MDYGKEDFLFLEIKYMSERRRVNNGETFEYKSWRDC